MTATVVDGIGRLITLARRAVRQRTSPAMVGQKDSGGRGLVPATGALTADSLVEPLRRILSNGSARNVAPPKAAESFKLVLGAEAQRTPFFCSGCPHNLACSYRKGRSSVPASAATAWSA